MTWVQLDHDWGLPCVTLALAGRWIAASGLGTLLHDLHDDAASCQRLQAWVQSLCDDRYPGIELVSLHVDADRDVYVLTVLHPRFPRTPPYARLPRWEIHMLQGANGPPSFTIVERSL